MKKVIGLGGIFFKSQDPKKMNEWYANNLGLPTSDYGTSFEWKHIDDPETTGQTVWAPFAADTKYFEPSKKEFMINFIVADIEGLVAELKTAGVTILDEIAVSEYGKFVHILDPDGNKVELWESAD